MSKNEVPEYVAQMYSTQSNSGKSEQDYSYSGGNDDEAW